MIKTLIANDEVLVRRHIAELITKFPSIEIVGLTGSGREACQAIREKKPELIFLDADLRDLDGFEVIKKTAPLYYSTVIMLSSYEQHAVRAFEFGIFDFILKPFSKERLQKTIQKALQSLSSKMPITDREIPKILAERNHSQESFSNVIPLKVSGSIHFIEMESIRYILGAGYYIEVFTNEKRFLVRESIERILSKLIPANFMRIHRSAIINTNFLEAITAVAPGEAEAVMKDGKIIRISRTYKEMLLEKMGV